MIKRNLLSIATSVLIIYLSLVNAKEFSHIHVFQFWEADKLVHFIMYSFLTGVLLFENRKIISGRRQLFIIVLTSAFLGGLLEVLQALLTTTRSGSIFDFLADLVGVLFSLGVYLLIRRHSKKPVR